LPDDALAQIQSFQSVNLRAMPVAVLEMSFRAAGDGFELARVFFEGARDSVGTGEGEGGGEHRRVQVTVWETGRLRFQRDAQVVRRTPRVTYLLQNLLFRQLSASCRLLQPAGL
jgi:hypothetical protein